MTIQEWSTANKQQKDQVGAVVVKNFERNAFKAIVAEDPKMLIAHLIALQFERVRHEFHSNIDKPVITRRNEEK